MGPATAPATTQEYDPYPLGALVGGRYELRRILGRGGAAVVFAAEHTLVHRPVALKIPRIEPELRELLCARLRRETTALARARHPAIVDVVDAGESEGLPFLAMELLEGRTLSGLITARGRMQPEEAVKIGIDLAAGLGAVHAAGFVHRDVKPSNVLITRSPLNQIHLCDFGIAKELGPKEMIDRKLTHAGSILGTPEYMPMEAFISASDADERADVYALGVTLFECLTGAVPFEGTVGQILMRLSSEKPALLSELRSDVPRALADVVARCLMPLAQRYANIKELEGALRACAPRPPEQVDLLRAAQPAPPPTAAGAPAAAAQGGGFEARRQYARVPYVTLATLQRDGATATDARIEDISEGGALVITGVPYPAGQTVKLRFGLPLSGKVLSLRSTIRWSRSARGAPAAGLEFSDLPDAARKEIRQYVALMGNARTAASR